MVINFSADALVSHFKFVGSACPFPYSFIIGGMFGTDLRIGDSRQKWLQSWASILNDMGSKHSRMIKGPDQWLLGKYGSQTYTLIHEADPQSRPVVSIVFAHVRSSVRPSFPNFHKTKQISSKNNVRNCQDCGSGRVDHL